MVQRSWEAENIDNALEGRDRFADAVACEFLGRLLNVIPPDSQMAAAMCAVFDGDRFFDHIKRNDFPERRAQHSRRMRDYEAAMKPLRAQRNRLIAAERNNIIKRQTADQYDLASLTKELSEIDSARREVHAKIDAVSDDKPRPYARRYVKVMGRGYPKATAKDIAYLRGMLAREAGRQNEMAGNAVYKNLMAIADLLEWPVAEREAVRLIWAIQSCSSFEGALKDSLLTFDTAQRETAFNQVAAVMLGVSRQKVSSLFAPDGELALSGVLIPVAGGYHPKLNETLFKLLDEPDVTTEKMLRRLIGEAATTKLDLKANFNYVSGHIEHVRLLVENAVCDQVAGCNIIVYGLQDSGKTEFTKALAKALDMPLYMLGETKAGHAEPSADERLGQILLAKRLTAHMSGVILAVDEAEELLKIRDPGADKAAGGVTKVFLNRLLERGQMTIWIVNDIDKIHPAVRRRMKYALPFGALTARDRLQAWKAIVKDHGLDIDPAALEALAVKYEVPVGSIVTAVENARLTTRDRNGLERSLRSTGTFVFNGVGNVLTLQAPHESYFPELAQFRERRFSEGPDAFRVRIAKHLDKAVAIYAHGPSGAGKKAFFRDIAYRNGREFMEHSFVEFFNEPEMLGDILRDATNKPCIMAWNDMAALNAYPVHHPVASAVRKRIAQLLDLIPVIHVFSSNVADTPPQWLAQDFPFILKYDHLSRQQIRQAWPLFFGTSEPRGRNHAYNALTPGHFATIARRNRGLGVEDGALEGALGEVSKIDPADQPKPGSSTPGGAKLIIH
ncbi:MAG: AAA family ATPase [Rhodospirillales bacterium]|nr:AAA family ATPase [Alphaproteobacteria bacterium]MCB9986744.1 AAA family ATPase [Rhodospirillales bacterium]USO08488.1 MAG: AAA family ATPase [Rhodospirillales bacterium]